MRATADGQARSAAGRDRLRVAALLLAALLPVVAIASALVVYVARDERRAADWELRARAARLADLVDREVEANLRVLEAMAASSSLDDPDLARVHEEAGRVLASQPSWLTVILLDAEGRQLLSARRPLGEPLPPAVEPASLREAVRTARPVVGDLSDPAPRTGRRGIAMRVPVPRGGEGPVRHVLTAVVTPEAIGQLFAEADVPGAWIAAVVDGSGRIVARNRDAERFVGRQPTAVTLAASRSGRPEGTYEGSSIDGVRVIAAYATSRLTGWTVHVGEPRASWDAARRRAVGAAALGCLATAILAAALAALVRRDRAARRRRVADEERQGMLLAELNHRVKNTLALVQAMARQTAGGPGGPAAAFAATFGGRVRALAAAHELLTSSAWTGAGAEAVVRRTLAPHGGKGQVSIAVTDVALPPALTQDLTLTLHELCTNAVKYGALSVPEGRVVVEGGPAEATPPGRRELRLAWREEGGPPVRAPAALGFGVRLIGRALVHGHGGTVDLDWRPDGLLCTIRVPVEARAAAPAAGVSGPA